MELKFNVDIKSVIPENISFNYEELDAEITQMLSKYTDTKVTLDNIGVGKGIRAKINKLVKSLKDERTSIKKKMLEPIEDFSNKIDLLVGKCNMVSGFIDENIKKIEEEKKAEKKSRLTTYMLSEIVRMKLVFCDEISNSPMWMEWFDSQKFLNATYGEDTAKLDILKKVKDVKDALAVLRATYPVEDDCIKAHMVYANCFDLAKTIGDMNKWKEDCKRIEQIKSAQIADPFVPQTKQFGDPIYETAFKVIGTKEQLKKLADFFKVNGIKLEVTSKMVEVK